MFVWVTKMLQYEKIDVSEGIDFNKSIKSNPCVLFHYYKFQPCACNKWHDLSMMVYDLDDLMILNIKGVDYKCFMFYSIDPYGWFQMVFWYWLSRRSLDDGRQINR